MAYIEFNHISKEYITGETTIKALDEASFIVEKFGYHKYNISPSKMQPLPSGSRAEV